MKEKPSCKIEKHQVKIREKIAQVSLGKGAKSKGVQNYFVFFFFYVEKVPYLSQSALERREMIFSGVL